MSDFYDFMEKVIPNFFKEVKEVAKVDKKEAKEMLESFVDYVGSNCDMHFTWIDKDPEIAKIFDYEEEEEEEYAILYDSKDGYISPIFHFTSLFEEECDDLSFWEEVRFYPDRDSKLWIAKTGEKYWTD